MDKQRLHQVVDQLPDAVDVGVDELVERIHLLRKLEIAERQLANGEDLTHEEVVKGSESWVE